MNSVSATQCSPCPFGGCGTGVFPAKDRIAAAAAATTIKAEMTAMVAGRRIPLLSEPHLDVSCRAHMHADMAADAFRVIGSDVTADGPFLLRHALHRGLRTEDHAVVALEAQTAAHASLAFPARLLLRQAVHAFTEIAEHLVGADLTLGAPAALQIAEMSFEQVLMGDHLRCGAILVVVNGELAS